MKGRIICPKCGHHIIAEISKDVPIFTLDCPECSHHFTVKTSQFNLTHVPSDSSVDTEEECDWEEHGEPRKTILSSIKPRTDKPMIAAILLTIVLIIGIISAMIPTVFLQSPVSLISASGATGSINVLIDNSSVVDPNELMISINQENTSFNRENDSFRSSSLQLGEHELTIRLNFNGSSTQSVTKKVYILPFDLSSYTIRITDTNPLSIDNGNYELGWISSIILILSVIAFIGAIMCWKRKHSDVAIIGSVVGIFSIGIFFISLILCIIAFYLIYTSRDEFDDGKKGKSF